MQHIRKTNRNLLPRNNAIKIKTSRSFFLESRFWIENMQKWSVSHKLDQKQHALGSNSSVKCSPENQNEDVCFWIYLRVGK